MLLCACAGKQPAPEPAAATAAPAPREMGKVALVNPGLSFVLIDFDLGFEPSPGVALKTFAPGTEPVENAETSILTVSAERRPPFVAADIIRGEPHKGDMVYQ